jgi:trehalose-phosphatase
MQPLFAAWPAVRERLRGASRIALLLDYDGTLTPIVSHPSNARLSAAGRRLLRSLSRRPEIWIALVSGRSLKEVRRMAGVKGLCYVGNHGLELAGPKIRHINPTARKSRPVMKKIAALLRKELKRIPGAWVEDKGLTLSVHCRKVNPKKKPLARRLFRDIVRPYVGKKQIRLTAGKEVFEVRPPARWTKGSVVNWLLARQELAGLARRRALSRGPVLPIYVGDDLTDEDAFRALGSRGVTVKVGAGNPLTRAQYRLRSPAEVERFLQRLIQEPLATAGGPARPSRP